MFLITHSLRTAGKKAAATRRARANSEGESGEDTKKAAPLAYEKRVAAEKKTASTRRARASSEGESGDEEHEKRVAAGYKAAATRRAHAKEKVITFDNISWSLTACLLI